jgi:hypothetical protein
VRGSIATLLALLMGARPTFAQASVPESDEALELFRDACLACHAPPDLRFAVDRAWLAQVADTA